MANGFYWHLHHDKLIEWCLDYQQRVDFIKNNKDEKEIELRLKLFQPIKGILPEELQEAGQNYNEARQKYDEAWQKYDEAGQKYDEARKNYYEARQKYDEAWQKYDEAGQNYNEALQKCDEALQKYDEIIQTLHEKECPNCPWNGKTIFTKV